MAIFVIGVKKLNNERYFRLFNSKVNENSVRDISEKDLIYLMRGNSNFKVQNADLKDNKIVGVTGSLDKIENGVCATIIGSINENNEVIGYKFVDTAGKVYNMKIEDTIKYLADKPIQNASIVNGKFLRGINWEIPIIENKISQNKDGKQIMYLHIDVNLFNYRFSLKMTDVVKEKAIFDSLKETQFLVYLLNCPYIMYVPNESVTLFCDVLRMRNIDTYIGDEKDKMTEVRILYPGKGFREDFALLQEVVNGLNGKFTVFLMRSKDTDNQDHYENEIWNIISDAKDNGIRLKDAFFLGTDARVYGNLKGALLSYVLGLDSQLKCVCGELYIPYSCNLSHSMIDSPIKVVDYISMDNAPYGCIILEMTKK